MTSPAAPAPDDKYVNVLHTTPEPPPPGVFADIPVVFIPGPKEDPPNLDAAPNPPREPLFITIASPDTFPQS